MIRPVIRPASSADAEDDRHGDRAAEAVRRQPHDVDGAAEDQQRRDREVEPAADDRRRAGHRREDHRRGDPELVGDAEVAAVLDQRHDEHRDHQQRREPVAVVLGEVGQPLLGACARRPGSLAEGGRGLPRAHCSSPSQSSLRSPKNADDEPLARDLAALELLEQLVLAEDQDAIHQLDVLVELGGQHHHRQPFRGQRAEQRVQVVLRADVDAARGVVEQQDARAVGQPARDDHLLLVAAREGRDRVLRGAEHDAEAVDVGGEATCATTASAASRGARRGRASAARSSRGSTSS